MGLKNISEDLTNISKNLTNSDIKKRELLINKFIEKFPKAKLHTLTQVNKYYNKKNIEFKLLHIETIQKSKSDKNSMYLLEKLRPAEFGTKAKQEGPTINIISAIIKDIQNDNTQSIITLNRGERKVQQDDTDRIIAGAKLLA